MGTYIWNTKRFTRLAMSISPEGRSPVIRGEGELRENKMKIDFGGRWQAVTKPVVKLEYRRKGTLVCS
jgi:hypothetical protein